MPVLLGYTGQSDELLHNYIEDSRDLWQNKLDRLDIAQIGCVVGTHAREHVSESFRHRREHEDHVGRRTSRTLKRI